MTRALEMTLLSTQKLRAADTLDTLAYMHAWSGLNFEFVVFHGLIGLSLKYLKLRVIEV